MATPINNASVMEVINKEYPDSIDFDDTDLDKFKDTYLQVFNNIMVFDWFDVETGIVYHHRKAINQATMRQYGMPTRIPQLRIHHRHLKFLPWLNRGPLFAINYERAIKGVLESNLDYERWEFDAQWKKKIPGLRVLNMRFGRGRIIHRIAPKTTSSTTKTSTTRTCPRAGTTTGAETSSC